MRLDAHTIARLARGAGFVGDAVTVATAVALATSGGSTSYHHRVGIPGAGDYRGLWGVDVDRYPDAGNVYNPKTAATVAYELTQAMRGWQWAPAYVNGAYTGFMTLAGVEQTRETKGQEVHSATTVPVAHLAIDNMLTSVRRSHHRHGNPRLRRAQPWPTLTES